MSKEGVFFVEASWVYQKAPKILVSILFWAQLEKSGLQIRKSSAEKNNFLLQVKIPNNQTKWCVQGQSLLGAKNHQVTHPKTHHEC